MTVTHPTRANLSREEIAERIAQLYKSDKERVVVFGLRAKFGGGASTGFGLVYDDEDAQRKFEPRYRLVRQGMAAKVEKPSRKLRKERKNRAKSESAAGNVAVDTLTSRVPRREEGWCLGRQEVNARLLLASSLHIPGRCTFGPPFVVWLSPGRSAVLENTGASLVSKSGCVGVRG